MNPIIQIDTREQNPLRIEAYPVEVVGLPVGDYGIAGFSDWANPAFIIERKSLPDLVSSLTKERDRFMRAIEKMRAFRFAALLIESDETLAAIGQFRSAAKPQSILQSLAALEVRANIHVIWAGNPQGAATWLERAARQFARGIEKDYKRLEKAQQRPAQAAV